MALSDKGMNKEPVSTDFGLPVRLITPTTAVPVSGSITASEPTSNTSAITYPALTGANQTLLAANASRKAAVITNDSGNTLYVKLGATASATSYSFKLIAGDILELGPTGLIWQGIIDAFSSAASGNAAVTELT